ncbi:PREDICTED: deoxyribose-phosphate aldolase-like isoform X1 [Amphimedon queenslandica]|uniref:Deoxyribose-phosphate aldolase n=1 Tax=Amphimedon queenslandica TaxID=400682 RepID=A0AAN0JWF1_AMPQE|nr:PREDICTED: deoxyribose-phosphate aldolase-like isoform X1 [Amphimedon queenslandica]|eukprot:XP_019861248.1 PREDICTED: deoxyribose-phosphate aldolase-like isoform X1 [Amphimedon queenslandica]
MAAGSRERNPGIPLDLGWVESCVVNLPAANRRAATHKTRRSIKKEWQAAWLLRAVTCIDLTTLDGDDTPSKVVDRLCHKASTPVRQDIITQLGMDGVPLSVGAVCVYPERVPDAIRSMNTINSQVPIASVAAGFPAGQIPLDQRLQEIKRAIEYGATEIDIVISRTLVLKSDWALLYEEVKACREACGEGAHLKTILGTGHLGTLTNVYKASVVCMMAGSDFIKTSTGKEAVNATFPVALTMIRAIREYHTRTGYKVGFKPAGGIRAAKDALSWLALMKEELGDDWTKPDLFRIGASSLLGDIERQLYHHVTGRYAAIHEMPLS